MIKLRIINLQDVAQTRPVCILTAQEKSRTADAELQPGQSVDIEVSEAVSLLITQRGPDYASDDEIERLQARLDVLRAEREAGARNAPQLADPI